MKISFDFDSTLDQIPMQKLASGFMEMGAEVFITTSRGTEMYGGIKLDNTDVFQLADKLGIKRENIIFTNYDDKFNYVKDMSIHFDDDYEQIFHINEHPLCKAIGFLYTHNFNRDNQIAKF